MFPPLVHEVVVIMLEPEEELEEELEDELLEDEELELDDELIGTQVGGTELVWSKE